MNLPAMLEALRKRTSGFLLSRQGAILAFLVLVVICSVFLVQTYSKAYRDHGNDYTSYLLSAQALRDGGNPYHTGSPFTFVYTLFLCVVLLPLAMVPYWLSVLLWFLGSLAALYATGLILTRFNPLSVSTTDNLVVLVVPFLILVNVIQNNLLNGQVNFFVLLLCSLFLREYLFSRKLTASLFLAAAIALKLTPLILLVYLLVRRDLYTAGLTVIMTMIFVAGLPYLIGGVAIGEFYSSYVDSFLTATLVLNGSAPHGFAFSITSIVGSLIPSFPKPTAILIASVLGLAPVITLQFTSQKDESNKKEMSMFSLYMLAMLLISPVSETHHLIVLFPALLVVVSEMLQSHQSRFNAGVVVLGVVITSFVFSTIHPGLNILAIATLYVAVMWFVLHPTPSQPMWRTQG